MCEKLFHIALITTGKTRRDHILQIGIVELNWDQEVWVAGRVFEKFLPTTKIPKDAFSQEHLKELYTLCHGVGYAYPAEVRIQIVDFFSSCGVDPENVFLTGKNLGSYVLPILLKKKILEIKDYAGVYEISSVHQFMSDILSHSINTEIKPFTKFHKPSLLKDSYPKYQAINTILEQTYEFNCLIHLFRSIMGKKLVSLFPVSIDEPLPCDSLKSQEGHFVGSESP